jgi:hypothetical protein
MEELENGNMIVITDITKYIVPTNITTLFRQPSGSMEFYQNLCYNNPDMTYEKSQYIIKEIIKGRRFKTPDGRTLCIGMSRDVQTVIGISYDTMEEQANTIHILRNMRDTLEVTIKEFNTAPFLSRLDYLLNYTFSKKVWPYIYI